MKKFRVWFTIQIPYYGFNEDFLEVEASNADEAFQNVLAANSDELYFEIQSVEPLD